jgi:hypothetical protein
MRPFANEIMSRVERSVERVTESGCWVWMRWCNHLGYGDTTFNGQSWTATRLVYAALYGPFDPDLDICHSCDVTSCVNPAHLRADTHKNNLLDASKRKRLQGQWKTHCLRGHPLEGDNLYRDPGTGFRHCKKCTNAKNRRKAGWPEKYWYADVKCPPGTKIDFATGTFVHSRTGLPVGAIS